MMGGEPGTGAQVPLLQATGLSKHFRMRGSLADILRGRAAKRLQAVDHVDLTVMKGETLGIVGESGCGKSTLARCLVRLYEPDTGSIHLDGREVTGPSGLNGRDYGRRVQMVFQDPYGSLNPRMTVGDALAEALTVHRLVDRAGAAARVRALLDLVHLPLDAADRYPHEFSGGQRQRVGIARALSVEPDLIIADEPVSALDVSVQAQIVNLFLELQERLGLALVFISHDLRLVRHIAHRTAVMYLGRIVEESPTEALFSNPRHPYTRALIASVPQIVIGPRAERSRQVAVRGELPSPLAPPPGCGFHPRCPLAVDRCRTDVPALVARSGPADPSTEAGVHRRVACHLAGEPIG